MTGEPDKEDNSAVRVPAGLHRQSRFFAATKSLWYRLGKLESAAVSDETENIRIDRPVYVTSLPRSGTTIVTEMLEQHPDLTSHRYSDFPNIWTPYWRNYLLQKSRREKPVRVERAHKDRIRVSNDSPEAVEEVLWMHFFPELHDVRKDQVLTENDRIPAFDDFYRDHIRKLLAVRNAKRYLAKGNYNVARIRYLLSLFPDARFLIPVRDPVHHVASLMKQHELFTRDSAQDPRIPLQMALSGHFEFGPLRKLINYGDDKEATGIIEAWEAGNEVDGWSRYWAVSYRHLADQIQNHPEVRDACLLFRYEDLCTESAGVIDRIIDHCGLSAKEFEAVKNLYTGKLSLPEYYQAEFEEADLACMERNCSDTLHRISDICRKAL
jgi:hypothetical protein